VLNVTDLIERAKAAQDAVLSSIGGTFDAQRESASDAHYVLEDLMRALIDTTAERDALRERVVLLAARLEAENARIKQGLFQAGQRFHAVVRTDREKSQIDAACNKWAWECHKIAGTSPAVPHPLLEEVWPQARTALQEDTPND
jgi:hypothetical protein